jgi:hypothetical protein
MQDVAVTDREQRHGATIRRKMATADRIFAARSLVSDRVARARHVLRHRASSGAPEGGVFNLDAHVAVIADVRTVLEERRVSLTSWSISGHTWVFAGEREPVAIVNERTWKALAPRSARRFRRVYGRHLRRFDGFVATYPPAFALLYEDLPGRTLGVCATRYEWPFTEDAARWDWLDDGLRRGAESGRLTLVANNCADADYVANYTGIHPTHIPSACSYVASSYTGNRKPVVICTKRDVLGRAVCAELTQEAIPLRAGLGKRYSWSDLYDHRALVVIPYNASLMSLFEHYSACAPIYVPNRAFLKQLMADHPEEVLSDLSFSQVLGRPAARRPHAEVDLNDLRDEQVVDWYLDRADFYDRDWMPAVRQFESWSHLDHLIATDDHSAIRDGMAADAGRRLERIRELWDGVEWLDSVGARRPLNPEPRVHDVARLTS